MTFRVLVDDNFHAMTLEKRRTVDEYATAGDALAACRSIVDRSLAEQYYPGIDARQLERAYRDFGEDPFIISTDVAVAPPRFSAWDYARSRSRELVRMMPGASAVTAPAP